MTIAAGIDVGTGAVKAALFRVENNESQWLSRSTLRIRQRDPMELARVAYDQVLAEANMPESEVDYVATTGEGEGVPFHTGHFYSMTTHARGAIYLDPRVEIGARRRSASWAGHQYRRAWESSELQDDEPMRLGLGTVPREYRALPWHRSG